MQNNKMNVLQKLTMKIFKGGVSSGSIKDRSSLIAPDIRVESLRKKFEKEVVVDQPIRDRNS